MQYTCDPTPANHACVDPVEAFVTQYPYLPPLILITWWFFILWLIGMASGWTTLASLYPGGGEDDNTPWRGFESGTLRCNYNGCLWAASVQRGLSIRTGPWVLFRSGHPPIRIPWDAVESLTQQKHLWQQLYVLKVRNIPFELKLCTSALPDVQKYVPHLMPAPTV